MLTRAARNVTSSKSFQDTNREWNPILDNRESVVFGRGARNEVRWVLRHGVKGQLWHQSVLTGGDITPPLLSTAGLGPAGAAHCARRGGAAARSSDCASSAWRRDTLPLREAVAGQRGAAVRIRTSLKIAISYAPSLQRDLLGRYIGYPHPPPVELQYKARLGARLAAGL